MSIVSHPPSATLPPDLESNRRIYDEYFDIEFAVQLSKHVLEILEQYYFRTRLINFELPIERNNPDRPLVFAGNHSGMAFPWDGIIFASLYLKMNNYQLKNATRPLSAPLLSRSTLMNPFLIPDLWKRVGCIDATFPNFETMMYYPDSNLFIYPEGVPGIGKGYNRRYRLQRLSSSFVYMSIKYKTDIVPVYTVNGEYINPQSYSIPWLNRLTEKIGIPFIPIGLLLPFLLIQPWMFYYSFPAKLTFVRGKRIKVYEMTDRPADSLHRDELRDIAENLRRQMQAELDEGVATYGKNPYSLREHISVLWKNRHLFPYTVPPGWPLLFAEFERAWKHRKAGEEVKMRLGTFSVLRIIFQNPLVLCYYIPILGWIPLLIKGYRNNKL